jgi:DNA repair protein RadA/Sms
MKKKKVSYKCSECEATAPKSFGKCPECNTFGSLYEVSDNDDEEKVNHHVGYAGVSKEKIMRLIDVEETDFTRIDTEFSEFNRVLGGGLVVGSVNLIGGDPGIGKSTILLQVVANLSAKGLKVIYISGEESKNQIKLRATRLKVNMGEINIYCETNVQEIIENCLIFKPDILIIDSIQTMYIPDIKSSAGSVSQVRESTQEITKYCKNNSVSCFLIGHITKEGAIAGPKVLEHIVDAVFYFEGEQGSKYRMLRSNKNRFGEVNELGIFAMTELGLKEIKNPSAIFLSKYEKEVSGSALLVTKEGSRPLIVEIQALVSETNSDIPRRICVGLDKDRLSLLMAILQKTLRSKFYKYDVYVTVVGGVKVSETASDVALAMALLSSENDVPLPRDSCFFGEIGLTGEVRPIPSGEERIKEAIKHGIKTIVVPKGNAPKIADWWKDKAVIIPIADVNDLHKVFNGFQNNKK